MVHFYPLWSTFTHSSPLLPNKDSAEKITSPKFYNFEFQYEEWYMYLSIYTRLLFGFHFVPRAERFHGQNGSARRTVYILACFSGSISLRRQNGSARRTVYVTLSGFISFRTQNRSRIDFLSALDAVFIFNPCDWNCWQRWRITQMGKVPLVLTPPFHEARGRGPKGRARAPWPPRGVKKRGDFSHLGESPPLAS